MDELIRGVIVQSGNDACVALAETIAGSEEAFAALMNREAQRLGMTNTHSPIPPACPIRSCTPARDLAVLASAIVRDFPSTTACIPQGIHLQRHQAAQPQNRLLYMDPRRTA